MSETLLAIRELRREMILWREQMKKLKANVVGETNWTKIAECEKNIGECSNAIKELKTKNILHI